MAYDFSNVTTRQLLKWLRGTYSWGYGRTRDGDPTDEPTYEEIKAELDKREHIPNKKESRVLAKKKVARNRDRKNRRYVR